MTTWVLLRGWTREHAHWGAFPSQLAAAVPGARVIMLDLPGAGHRHTEACPWRVEDMARSCRETLRQMNAPTPCVLLGLSLGGMVAAAWSAAWPSEVAGCVLVNTSMRPFSTWQQRLQPRRMPGLLRMLATRDARDVEKAILSLTTNRPAQHAELIDDWVAIRKTRPVSSLNTFRQLCAAARYGLDVATLKVPLLVVCSAMDALVDPACSRELARQALAELVTHPWAGHDLPLDDGRWLAERAAIWFRHLI
jgi:pimeloyl-ACP methyl ester carboxylesterase